MRGLRLYIRPIEPSDQTAIAAFLAKQPDRVHLATAGAAEDPQGTSPAAMGTDPPIPAWGLLGKLLGEIVAVVSLEITDDALRIDDLIVDRELRRKWIGRAMLREVEQLAVRMDLHHLVVNEGGDAQEFLRRVGFESEGERWIRKL